ncbi:SRPBCC family protein [Halomonas stenophila]|uniref:Putative membrane protein n=1 Tax=Halomonas stenophila TaxID=795312 RepID=A0A7W5ESV1_9GAMM|nr:SRPBCC family protein [Halomonas stenophila]MBB3230130.1 putative membrane protein [Halomonas stenophila]
MPVIEHEAEIAAHRDAVFALVSQVERFADYSEVIDTIECLSDGRYRWRVRVAGLRLTFDIAITAFEPPERFAWRSVGGVPNRGEYRLMPTANGTRIHLWLEYHLANRLAEKTVRQAAGPLLQRLSRDIIDRMEAELAAPTDDVPAKTRR